MQCLIGQLFLKHERWFGKGKTFTLQEYIGQYFQGRLEVGWRDTKMITCYRKQVTCASTIACQFMIM